MKEEAWGARPRTVKMAALLGVRLNDRRPAPICMGGCAAQGVGLGGPSPVAHTPGLGDCPPPPARPSRALACKQGVLGLRGEVGWWGEGSNPTPGPPGGGGGEGGDSEAVVERHVRCFSPLPLVNTWARPWCVQPVRIWAGTSQDDAKYQT